MALTDESNGGGMVMPVAPYGGNNGGFGGDWWGILLLIALLNGGFGGWGMGGMMWPMMMGMGGFGGGWGMNELYPWMNNSQNINGGFRDQMLNSQLDAIQGAICNGFAQAESSANARQMADMQQSFALQSALQNCCCENRAATADLKYTVATEACADRTAAAQNTRDIIDAQTRGTQTILDKLCQLELDGVKAQLAQAQRENVGLQNAVNMANIQASQVAQTSDIVNSVYNRLSTCPVGTTPVYGNQPIFTCGQNAGCGCGCGVA